MIPIYSNLPSDWKNLQIITARIFNDIGYETFIEKSIKTARGNVNVDILCTKNSEPFDEKIIIECKQWNKSIPKTIIHSFRSVVSDSGANYGYIISKKGFQKGAIEAASNSNIKLLSFEEFQSSVRTKWLSHVIDTIYEKSYPLRRYCSPTETYFDQHLEKLPTSTQKKIVELQMRYYTFSLYTAKLPYKDLITNELFEEYLEKSIQERWASYNASKLSSLMEYYTWLNETSGKVISELDTLFGSELRKR